MKIIGTKFFGHDSAIFVLDIKNKKVFAVSTERISRIKHDINPPEPVIKEYSKLLWGPDYVCHSFLENKLVHLRSALFTSLIYKKYKPKYIKEFVSLLPKSKSRIFFKVIKNLGNNLARDFVKLYIWELLKRKFSNLEEYEKYALKNYIKKMLSAYKINIPKNKICLKDHHLCHAFSAYYFSPFNKKKAIVFTLDGWGDGKYSTLWIFEKNKRELISQSTTKRYGKEIVSIGVMYSLFTETLGFRRNSDEGKTEALAAYGKLDKNLYELLDRAFYINKDELRWETDMEKIKILYDKEFLKKKKEEIGGENFAATIQRWLEDTVVEYLNLVYKRFKISRLAMAGGVVANVIMNLNIFERTPFKEIYIFPAMADDGTAVGAALIQALELGYDISWVNKLEMPYWGPSFSKEEVEKELKKDKWKNKIKYRYVGDRWPEMAAEMVANGKIVAIFQGKMEFGPRALGNRSILGDPRDPKTREKLNSKVKRRPWFQPFCPSVLEEDREKLFERSYNHKHMAIAFRMKKKYWKKLPSAIHVDGTARPQFVEEKDNPKYYRLLKRFKELTGYGIIVNTSFNLHGRTIVRTPADALTDFVDCGIDVMFIEGYLVERKNA